MAGSSIAFVLSDDSIGYLHTTELRQHLVGQFELRTVGRTHIERVDRIECACRR